jgi:hypothetical protein
MARAVWLPRTAILLPMLMLATTISAACNGNLLSRKYEYEEDIYLELDGSATVYVNASLPALVALRGLDLDVDPAARLDRDAVRAMYESPVTEVESVTGSRRENRRYVHLRIEVPDVSRLSAAAPFAWSQYAISRGDSIVKYHQRLGPSAARDVGDVGWTGDEFVAIRLHLPSRVPFHNSPSRTIERGNIIVWEQPLSERLRGQPLEVEAHMEQQSILARTLTLFVITTVFAMLTLALFVWLVMRRGRTQAHPREQEAS